MSSLRKVRIAAHSVPCVNAHCQKCTTEGPNCPYSLCFSLMKKSDAFEHFKTAIAIDSDIICLQEQKGVHCNWGVPCKQFLNRLKKSLRNKAARMKRHDLNSLRQVSSAMEFQRVDRLHALAFASTQRNECRLLVNPLQKCGNL